MKSKFRFTMLSALLIVILLIGTTSVFAKDPPDKEWNTMYHYGKVTVEFYRTKLPGISCPASYVTAYEKGISSWNTTMSSSVKYAVAFRDNKDNTATKNKTHSTQVSYSDYGNTSWAGQATGTITANSSNVITSSTMHISINVTAMIKNGYTTNAQNSVLAHEMGHILQLGDMYSKTDRLMGKTNAFISAQKNDIATLKTRYK
jgi:M6 family metalloprotease-like protein